MTTIEQSTLSIVETVARAESKGKDIYVTDKGKVKVQEGLSGWWAGRKIKSGNTTQAAHNERAINQFIAALARESQPSTAEASSKRDSVFSRLTQSVSASGPENARLSSAALINVRDFVVGSQAEGAKSGAPQASAKIVEKLKTGTYDFSAKALPDSKEGSLGVLRLENDLRILAHAIENVHEEIEVLRANADNASIPVDASRLNALLAQLSELKGAANLLLYVAEQQPASGDLNSPAVAPSSVNTDVIQSRSGSQVVEDILADKGGRLSAIEAKVGVRLENLSAIHKAHFENLLQIYVDPEHEVSKSEFTLDVERRNNPDVEPEPTTWRGKDINDDAAKNILRFLSQPYVDEANFSAAEQDAERGGKVLRTLLEVGSKPLDSLSEQDYQVFTRALQDYVLIVGGNSVLQQYLRLGSSEETPQAPEALKERLRSALLSQVGVQEGRAVLLNILSQDSLLNVLQANVQKFGDTSHDPYDLARLDSNALHQINTVNQKLLTDLLGNLTVVLGDAVQGYVPGDEAALTEYLEEQVTEHPRAQQSIDSILRPYSEAVLSELHNAIRADHFDRLNAEGFEFDAAQKQNYEQLISLNLTLTGQLRAGNKVDFPNSELAGLGADRQPESALTYSLTLPPSQKLAVSEAVAQSTQPYVQQDGLTEPSNPDVVASLKAALSREPKDSDEAALNLTEEQRDRVAEQIAGLVAGTALQQSRDTLLASALGSFEGSAETLVIRTEDKPANVSLSIVDGGIRVQLAQYGELTALGIQTSGVAVAPGVHSRPADAAGTSAGVVQRLEFTVSLDDLLQNKISVRDEDLESTLEVWVPDSAYYVEGAQLNN